MMQSLYDSVRTYIQQQHVEPNSDDAYTCFCQSVISMEPFELIFNHISTCKTYQSQSTFYQDFQKLPMNLLKPSHLFALKAEFLFLITKIDEILSKKTNNHAKANSAVLPLMMQPLSVQKSLSAGVIQKCMSCNKVEDPHIETEVLKVINGCHHQFCLGCLRKHINTQYVQNPLIECPQCKQQIQHIQIEQFIGSERLAQLKEKLKTGISPIQNSQMKCSFCDKPSKPGSGRLVCSDCKNKLETACVKQLKCKHYCNGIINEKVCSIQCLICTKNEDYCTICYTETLIEAPCIQSKCGHIFHYKCIMSRLEKKWGSQYISFGFCLCPLCKRWLEFPKDSLVQKQLSKINELHSTIRRQAQLRLGKCGNGVILNIDEAMEQLAFYQCIRCQNPYFGGRKDCQLDYPVQSLDLLCPTCCGIDSYKCKKHGTEYIEFKCRFCCNIAMYFCWGTTHFCQSCHKKQCEGLYLTKLSPNELEKCPGPGQCPIGGQHKPNGEEYCLGCCKNCIYIQHYALSELLQLCNFIQFKKMKPKARRAQSSDQRGQSATKRIAISGGYTMYNQVGQKFNLPNVKMVAPKTIEDIEYKLAYTTIQETQTRIEPKKFKTIDQPVISNTLILSKALNYRVAQPYSCTQDFNAKLWEQSNKATKGLKRVSSAVPQVQVQVQSQMETLVDDSRTMESSEKPYQFLAQLGGKMLLNDSSSMQQQQQPNETQKIMRPQTTTTLYEDTKKQHRPIQSATLQVKRPMTTTGQRPPKYGERIQSATLNVAQKIERIVQREEERPQSQWSMQRPISAKTVAPQQFFQMYTKYTNFSALDLPYEELFDRNERTVAATFARFGDLGYYSPIQRIGSYMQYSAKLKMSHLLKIIDLQKTMSSVEHENEVPIQLAIINDLDPQANRDKTGVNSGADDTFTREPVTLSLYPEYFEDNDEKVSQMELSMQYFNRIVDEMGGTYDPCLLGVNNYLHVEPELWTANIKKEVEVSCSRFAYYITSEQIRSNEVPKFKKEWMVRACSLISDSLLANEDCSRRVFQEIFEVFKMSMKRAMLEYILRSPEERKRLHITLIPRPFTCSAQRIAREGAFNIRLFPDWHEFVERGRSFCSQNLTLLNRITSAMQNWSQDFDVSLGEINMMKQVAKLGYTFSIAEFTRTQTLYRIHVVSLLENVYYRGALSIVKLSKFLRSRNNVNHYWSLVGASENKVENKQEFFEPLDVIEYFRQQIRVPYLEAFQSSSQAFTAFLEYTMNKRTIVPPLIISSEPMQELPGLTYKKMEKEQKKKIILNATTLMQLQLRQIVQKSTQEFENQFCKIPVPTHSEIICERFHFQNLPQMWAQMKDQQFTPPSWDLTTRDYSPFLRLDLAIQDDTIRFVYSDDMIKGEIIDVVRSQILAFEKFLQLRFAKVNSVNVRPETVTRSMLNFESDTKDDSSRFFKSYWPHIQVSEKKQKEHPELLLATDNNKQNIEKKTIQVAHLQESCFIALENRLADHLTSHLNAAHQTLQIFQQFTPFYDKTIDKEIKLTLTKKVITNDEFKQIQEILAKYQKLIENLPNEVAFPIFMVNCRPVVKQLKAMIIEYKERVFIKFESLLIEASRTISDRYVSISSYIRRSLKTPEDVEAMDKYLTDVNQERVGIRQRTLEIFTRIMFLIKQDFTLTEPMLALSEELYQRPALLDRELIEQEEKHAVERQRLEDALRQQKSLFEERILIYCDEMHNFETFTEKAKYKNYIIEIEEFESRLEAASRELLDITHKESTLFGYTSEFENFAALKKAISPYSELWKSIGIFMENRKKWMAGPICEVDASEMEAIIKQQNKVLFKLLKNFKTNSIPHRVSQDFQEDVQYMTQHQTIVELLSNPGLRQRHWDEVNKLLGTTFQQQDVALKDLLMNKVGDQLPAIEEVSENASKEFMLESGLRKMQKEWETLSLVIVNYKNVLVLQGSCVEEIQVQIDEHAIKAQTIRANPQVKFMEEEAIQWEKTMLFIQEILELWVKVQGMYLYLEPIFSFEDISKTLEEESEKFTKVSTAWKSIMKAVQDDPLALHLERIPSLMTILKDSLQAIEQIQKGLEQHLEVKRLEFPRFFFLSNDDLINILAETRDPLLVQPHMRKCFEGIDELIFSSNTEIVGMKSGEKEEVQFDNRVIPKEFKNSVEKWLLRVEAEMQETLHHLLSQSYSELLEFPNLTTWTNKWPGQCILVASCLNFTRQIEETVTKGKTLHRMQNDRQQYLTDIVSMVRQAQSNNECMLLSALIVLEVHNNDILDDLADRNFRDISIFEWMSQMRYYIDAESKAVSVKMVFTTLRYGYEYLGIGTRLVITPLTDRCYRTLVGALQLNLGGAPEGPAGTGKTESTKDLAKAVAMQCIVFNCGEGLNTHAMAKFFKGLASAGAWSCFDEFNRIDLEVLSVIAQQILQIQQAKAALQTKFVFEGTELMLKSDCNVFITMNPGYAGRSELPDNLKALFRPCAMMVPDYSLIAEISLYSFGFVEARILSKKIVAVYKLCSEQLSSQDHYDYGMRAVKSVLTAAQQLKRKQPSEKEELLIYRAISDINLPKFLAPDVSLFNGIMSDLFPEVKGLNVEYKALNDGMNHVLQQNKMQLVPQFKRKVLQLYEMINCRHGLMIVGQTMSGKSTCLQVLANTMTFCNKHGLQDEKQVQIHALNPKAITLQELYGYSDPVSKEWTEGVLGELYRKCATSQSSDRQWLVFDGPVDAGWIENMNTVLDDNKKLCLMSGETIAMSDRMSIIFEVQDLTQASPATVSRCGMVYMQPDQLGWLNILYKHLQSISLDQQVIQRIQDLFEAIVDKCQKYAKSKTEYEPVPENSFCLHLLHLLVALLSHEETCKWEEYVIKVDALFIFATLWTVGASIDETGRKQFDLYFKKMIKEPLKVEHKKDLVVKIDKQSQIPELANTSSYDFFYSQGRWRNWKEKITDQTMPLTASFSELFVSTQESVRITYVIMNTLKEQHPILLIGASGVGKTTFIQRVLEGQQDMVVNMSCSATTSAGRVQSIIESRLERRRKGTLAPPLGQKGLIFIDDLNMPAPDKYGCQSPIELLRQLHDQKGWYSKERQLMSLIDLTVIASMGLPGGGRSHITPRLIRHLHVVAITSPDHSIMNHIYQSIMEWHITKIAPALDADTRRIFEICIEAAVDLYSQLRDSLKPTPRKSWYLLNTRDLARVVQGITLVGSIKDLSTDNKKIQRLWLHEVSRTFYDRLAEEDHDLFNIMLTNSIKNKLRDDFKYLIKPYEDNIKFTKLSGYLWSDILSEEMNPADRKYNEVLSLTRATARANYHLEELNQGSKKPMNLALFDFAIEHLLKIQRVLTMQQGHLLLIGLGGSGRSSLTRLASYTREVEFVQLEIGKQYSSDQWKEDLQRILSSAGGDAKETCLLISDSQMQKQFILEDISSLLNSGEVPGLFAADQFIPLVERLRARARKDGKLIEGNTEFQKYFIENTKKRLHITLTMSPVGEALRSRIRMFPSIVNCSTVDCFHQWPEEALEAVARKFFAEATLDVTTARNLVSQCKMMHEQLIKVNTDFRASGRHSYVTPSSYFELLRTFSSILNVEKVRLDEMRTTYHVGVQKLDKTNDDVQRMERELIEKQPLLVKMSQEASELAKIIEAQAEAMQPKLRQVEQEEVIVTEGVKEAELINQECEKDLAIAKPKLKQAEDALNTLSPNDINSIKAMLKPPETVQLVMESVCVLCGVPAMVIPNPTNPKERIQSYWEASKKFLAEKDFLQRLIGYDKNNINPVIMQKVREKYVSKTQTFNPKRVEQASSAAKGLCEWVLALNEYEKVLTVVRPKQQKYMQSKQEVNRLQESLRQTRAELDLLNTQIGELRTRHAATLAELDQLQNDIKDCEIKLQRATKLMQGLGGERERWSAQAIVLDERLRYVIGDVILSSGLIAYCGVFSAEFREKTVSTWQMKSSVEVSSPFSLINTLGQKIMIRKWRINGLPSDNFSIENGIIITRAQRYALLIDPQGQGNRFLKQNELVDEKMNPKLKVTKLTDPDFFRQLENSLQFGLTLLIENVGEDLDSSLDSLLMKQWFKSGGVLSVKVGENVIPVSKGFQLFLTTKLANPHYTPEVSTKVSLVNFTITQRGLEDQLLELCVTREQPNLEEEKNRQIVMQHKNQQDLQRVEEQILKVLNKASNILDDEQGIEVLQKSKEVASDIEERQKVSEFTEKKIDEARIQYKPIAQHAALLFLSVISLAILDPMYQYSLAWLINLYQESFNKAEQSTQIKNRINNVNNTHLSLLYQQVSRGLFEKDKILFSFLILIKLLDHKKQIDPAEYAFIIQPLQEPQSVPENPLADRISKQVWARMQCLFALNPKYTAIVENMQKNPTEWAQLLNDPNGHQIRLPDPFLQITQMQRMCIIKAMRPGKLPMAIQDFVTQELGEKYTQPPAFSLQQSFSGSNCHQPLLFILPGTDPMNALMNFADSKAVQLRGVSLGQGQGVVAEKEIEEAKSAGNWVILQNCHLAPSWMSSLERICEDISSQKIHSQFRLWLTSYPSDTLPSSVIQQSVKMTNEPPNGLRSNMCVSFQSAQISAMNFKQMAPDLLKQLYSLCFLHAILQERRNYGSIGFNIYYDFNQSDLLISVKQLEMINGQSFTALNYLVGECNYGGRVTDERDRRVIKALLQDYLTSDLPKEYQLKSNEDMLSQLQELPAALPALFGFHPNAEITKDLKESDELLVKLRLISGQSSNTEAKPELVLKQICQSYLPLFPKKFDLEIAQAKYPLDYKNSYNTVLQQEIVRYNKLTAIITNSLSDIEQALKGLIAMSDSLEKVTQSLLLGQVPDLWKKHSYPSLKPLSSYIHDLLRRLKYFQTWIEKHAPYIHWVSGFFFTHSFLTAVLQNHARRYTIAIDKLQFDFQFFEEPIENMELNQAPRSVNDGTLIFGLYLEGCKWDYGRETLDESDAKTLFTMAPIIHLKPREAPEQADDPESLRYKCPVYKTAERKGTLSTTGHSTNFIMSITIPSQKNQRHWIKRGVAMLCQLSD